MRFIMKKNWYAPTLLTLALAALALPASAAVDTYHFRGQAVFAEWDAFDGCIATSTFISGFESRTHDGPGSPSAVAAMDVAIYAYDYCNDTELVSAYGYAPLPNSQLISGGFQSATLQTTVQGYDYVTGAEVPIVVNVHWEGQGEVYRTSYHSRTQTKQFRYRASAAGSVRSAALTGDVSIAGVSYTPASAVTYATLSQSQSGSVFILH